MRTSVAAGIVSTGARGHVELWTRDNGRHWFVTSAVGGSGGVGDPAPLIVGRESLLYWGRWDAATVHQVQPWPPTGEAVCNGEWVSSLSGGAGPGNICVGSPVDAGMRAVPVLTVDDARLQRLASLPTGFAAVFRRNRDGGLTIAVRDQDANVVRELPSPEALPRGWALLRGLSSSWPRLTLRVTWLDTHPGSWQVSWQSVYSSTDGGRTWNETDERGWRRAPELPVPRAGAAAAGHGEAIVLVGGRQALRGATVASRRVDAFDPRTGTWQSLAGLPVAVSYASAASTGGRIYVIGGFDRRRRARRQAFVLEGRTWRPLPRPPVARAAAGAAVVRGKIYVAGGVSRSGRATRMLVLDPRRRRWSLVRGPRPRAYLAVAGIGGRVFAFGGRVGDVDTSTRWVDAYDPARGRWELHPPAPVPRSEQAAVAVGSLVVTLAGIEDWYVGDPSVYAFDARTRRWTRLPDLVIGRYSLTAATIGNRVYALGGGDADGPNDTGPASEYLDVSPTTSRGRSR